MPADGILDSLVQLFGSSSVLILNRILLVTLPLFVLLVSLQWAWDLVMWVLVDDQNFVGKAMRRFVLHSFFYLLILVLPLWLPPLLQGWEWLGQQVTGLEGLSPSSIFNQGVALAGSIHLSWKLFLTPYQPVAIVLQTVTFWLVVIAFSVIAFQLARVVIEGTLVLGAMVIFLAFSAHRMTFGLFEGYIRYAMDVGIRVYLVYVLVWVGHDLGTQLDTMVRDATFLDLADPRLLLTVPAAAALYALIVWSLPKTISGRLVESLSFSGINPLGGRS
jgi:type IV secretion system protein TrbL